MIATHNAGKVREIAALLGPYISTFKSAGELGLGEPEETGSTFAENAKIKALASALESGMPSLADDSGLAVYALNGDPGIYSARWAGPSKDFTIAMKKVEEALGDNQDRRAAFICALCLAWPDGHCDEFEGDVWGEIVDAPRGTRGFGYDPIFRPNGYDITFGEMAPEKKHEMSHRAVAFRKFVAGCFS